MPCCSYEAKPSDFHYIWMGPTPQLEEYIGQDTIGPDLLSESYPKIDIYFWCLAEYKPYYDAYFKNKKTIKVKDIETRINRDTYHRRNQLLPIIKLLEDSAKKWDSPKDKARERVSIKELIQYYLQTHHRGFFADTNIIPSPRVNEWIEPPERHHFCIPQFDAHSFDVWLMYSPRVKYLEYARFEFYLNNLIDELRQRVRSANKFIRSEQTYIVMRTIQEFGSPPLKATLHSFTASDCLSLQKRYHNSHCDDSTLDALLTRLKKEPDAKRELNYYLEKRKPKPKVVCESNTSSRHDSANKQRFFKWLKSKLANTQSDHSRQLKAGNTVS